MRLLAIAAVAAIALMLTGPPTASAQYRTYDPFTGTATTYYYIPPQGVPDSLWIYPYAGGPPRTYGPRDVYTYNPAYQSRNYRGFFSPYRSDYGSFYSPYYGITNR